MRSRSTARAMGLALTLTSLAAGPAAAQDVEDAGRLVPGLLGGVAGLVGGGYIALSVIVLESRYGRYVHDIDDVLGWRSAPVIIGGAAGTMIGVTDPDRLLRTVVLGAAGWLAGASVGAGLGTLFGDDASDRWAGLAIGGGAGLMLGNLAGLLLPSDTGPLRTGHGGGVPLYLRLRF